MQKQRFVPLGAALILWGAFQGVIHEPQWAFVWGSGAMVLFIGAVALLTRMRLGDPFVWHASLSPCLLIVGAGLFVIFLDSIIAIQSIAAVASFLIALFLENIDRFLHRPTAYQPYTLEHLSLAVNFLSFFLLFSGLFALRIFLNLPAWLMMTIAASAAAVLSYQTFWAQKTDRRRTPFFVGGIALASTEVFWVLLALPTSFLVDGVVASAFFFVLVNLSRFHAENALHPRRALRTVGIGFAVMVLTFATAQWS